MKLRKYLWPEITRKKSKAFVLALSISIMFFSGTFLASGVINARVSVDEDIRYKSIIVKNNLPIKQRFNINITKNTSKGWLSASVKSKSDGNYYKSIQTQEVEKQNNWTSTIALKPGVITNSHVVKLIVLAEYADQDGQSKKVVHVKVEPGRNTSGLVSARDISWREYAALALIGSVVFTILARRN